MKIGVALGVVVCYFGYFWSECMIPAWIEKEFVNVDFDDKRLVTRLKVALHGSARSLSRHHMLAKARRR
jgi:hypothetical protein